MLTVFPAHALADEPFARELTSFLESGCDGVSVAADAAIRPGEDILSSAEIGLSADVLLLVLSPASNMARWQRERWEPILFGGESGTRIGVILLAPCVFPDLWRRKLKFFDATTSPLAALRQIKRWVKGRLDAGLSPELDPLYRELADRPGTRTTPAHEAGRFARDAEPDFEAVCRIASAGRTLAQIAGELGIQLGMTLDGPLEDNCRRIRDLLRAKRCLVLFDSPGIALDSLIPEGGRTSFLFATGGEPGTAGPKTLAAARRLVSANRLAEAYELLHELFDAGIDSESCARELTWICDHWGWYVEAGQLRATYRLPPVEQLALF